jgi:hypothetical protein
MNMGPTFGRTLTAVGSASLQPGDTILGRKSVCGVNRAFPGILLKEGSPRSHVEQIAAAENHARPVGSTV